MLSVHVEVSHNLELINSTRWNALIDELLLRPVSLDVICHQLMHIRIYIYHNIEREGFSYLWPGLSGLECKEAFRV